MVNSEDKLLGLMNQQSIESLLDNCIIPLGYLEQVKKDFNVSVVKEEGRQSSEVITLRNLHNYIKDFLIDRAINVRRMDGYSGPISLVDIAAGKGGDIHKWNNNNIFNVWGMEIDQGSIDKANQRLNETRKKFRSTRNYTFSQKDVTVWDKSYIDSVTSWLREVTGGKGRNFDIASCMFAFNYFFKDERSVNNVLRMVSYLLKPGGVFIGVYLDKDKLINFLSSKGVKKIGETYESKNLFVKNLWGKTSNPEYFGAKYEFKIKDKGDKNIYEVGTEYVMDYDWFKTLAETGPYYLKDVSDELSDFTAGLQVTSRHFQDLYPLILGVEGDKFILNEWEQEITELYSFFMLKKTPPPRKPRKNTKP